MRNTKFDMDKGILLKGSLKQYSLTQILTFLNKTQRTGTLILERDNVRKSIYFMDGNAIFASSNKTTDRLGDMLLRTGNINTEQYSKSAKLYEETGKRKGIILVELGYLKPADLFKAIRNQVKEIILSLFEWEDGNFKFEEVMPSVEVITLNTPVEELIREGLHRIEGNKRKEINAFIQKVNELYKKLNSLTHYELLEVTADATYADIKKSYLEKVKYYHPDRYHTVYDETLKEKLSKILALLNEAYTTLKDQKSRVEYDKFFFKFSKNKTSNPEIIRAKEHFKRAAEDFKKGNFWNAADFFRWATRLDPKKATYWAHLSLALSKIPRRIKEAEEAMLKAIKLEPNNANYYVHLGTIYLNSGMKLRAIRQFETALKWDPENTKALRELEKLKSKK